MTTSQQAAMEASQAFHAHEMDVDDGPWEAWLAQVSHLTGIANLDGDNSARAKAAGTADGYSLDELFVQFEARWSPQRAADAIPPRRA